MAIIYLGSNNLLRDVPKEKVKEFEELFLMRMEQDHAGILEEFRKGKLEDASLATVKALAAEMSSQYRKN